METQDRFIQNHIEKVMKQTNSSKETAEKDAKRIWAALQYDKNAAKVPDYIGFEILNS